MAKKQKYWQIFLLDSKVSSLERKIACGNYKLECTLGEVQVEQLFYLFFKLSVTDITEKCQYKHGGEWG